MRLSLPILFAVPLLAQDALSLRDAVTLGLAQNKSIAASGAMERAAAAGVDRARGGRLPKLDYTESWTRSDNPVFVFGSLLTEHQFGAANFNLGPLNRPDALNNFQSQLTLDQPLYDAGLTKNAVKSAGLSQNIAGEERRRTGMETIAGVARAYYGAVLAAENLRTAERAVASAEADLRRAESIHTVGMSTDADVLSIRVHLADVSERRIQRAADLDVAKAALNDAMGLPLDTPHTLTTGLTALAVPGMTIETLEREASSARPETRETLLAADLARTRADAAHSALLPQVSFHAALEADRQQFVTKGGANWLASVALRWNLFNGLADKARIEESREWVNRARADEQRVDSAVRLEVRRAWASLHAAGERIAVAQAAVAQAEESLRITQNRYEAGMSNVTDLLRNESAALESRTRYLAAIHDQRVAATLLELAAGRLTANSEVLN
jgi:outer membrane protein TolC